MGGAEAPPSWARRVLVSPALGDPCRILDPSLPQYATSPLPTSPKNQLPAFINIRIYPDASPLYEDVTPPCGQHSLHPRHRRRTQRVSRRLERPGVVAGLGHVIEGRGKGTTTAGTLRVSPTAGPGLGHVYPQGLAQATQRGVRYILAGHEFIPGPEPGAYGRYCRSPFNRQESVREGKERRGH